MKKLLWTLVPALFCAHAQAAAKLNLDLRADAVSDSYNAGAIAAGEENETRFLINTARLDLRGDLSEEFSYRVRMRFNNETTVQGPDGMSNRLDYGYIAHKMGSSLSLTMGKFATDVGGHETIADSRDLYFKSEAGAALTAPYTALGSTDNFFYQTKYNSGARLGIGLGESELALMMTNNPEAENVATSSIRAHNRFMTGAVWKGKFAEGTLLPILSYHTYKSNRQTAANLSETKADLIAAGLKWQQDGTFAQLDYVDLQNGPQLIGGVQTDLKIKSWVAETGFKMDRLTPKVKLESSRVSEVVNPTGSVSRDILGIGLALEYQPQNTENARYHIAGIQKQFKQENVETETKTQLIVGMTFLTDLMK